MTAHVPDGITADPAVRQAAKDALRAAAALNGATDRFVAALRAADHDGFRYDIESALFDEIDGVAVSLGQGLNPDYVDRSPLVDQFIQQATALVPQDH